jgi:hypothetical protein
MTRNHSIPASRGVFAAATTGEIGWADVVTQGLSAKTRRMVFTVCGFFGTMIHIDGSRGADIACP